MVPPDVKVITTSLPDWLRFKFTLPVGAPGPVRLSMNAEAMPAGNVTASENVTLSDETIERWTEPSLTMNETTLGTVEYSKAPMSTALPTRRLWMAPRWS